MIAFEFANMEYSSRGQHEFQYQLIGFDPEPILAGRNNTAVFHQAWTRHAHTFRVQGRNRDGCEPGARHHAAYRALPPGGGPGGGRTRCTFVLGRACCWAMCSGSAGSACGWSVRWSCTRELAGKRRSEELLRNILPGGWPTNCVPPDGPRPNNTIGSPSCSAISKVHRDRRAAFPAELVDELNVCFKAFDRIMEKHGVEKDEPLVTRTWPPAGVPDPEKGGPLAVVRAALDMQEIVQERKAERTAQEGPLRDARRHPYWSRGRGVVGLKKFQYDIWGDTVNIASRIESSGAVGQVNISASTHAEISENPDLVFREARGQVMAKGGELEMYFVSRRYSEHQGGDDERLERFLATGSAGNAGACRPGPAWFADPARGGQRLQHHGGSG